MFQTVFEMLTVLTFQKDNEMFLSEVLISVITVPLPIKTRSSTVFDVLIYAVLRL